MYKTRRFARPIATLLVTAMIVIALPQPAVYAAMVGTEAVVALERSEGERALVEQYLQREDVRNQLSTLGVDPRVLDARVGAMTDQEVAQLAGKLQELPAGGDALIIAAIVFGVLVLAELVGLIDFTPIGR